MKKLTILMAAALAVVLAGCQSKPPLAGPPPDAWHIPKIKVALYLDVGCKGGGVIHWAELLRSSPDVACTFINAADVQAGKLKDFDVLVMPGRLPTTAAFPSSRRRTTPRGRTGAAAGACRRIMN